MAAFLITYDLNYSGQNYRNLEQSIKNLTTSYAKIATTTYIINSNLNSTAIRDNLSNHVDNNDELFVSKLTGEAAWKGLSDEISSWLKNNLSK